MKQKLLLCALLLSISTGAFASESGKTPSDASVEKKAEEKAKLKELAAKEDGKDEEKNDLLGSLIVDDVDDAMVKKATWTYSGALKTAVSYIPLVGRLVSTDKKEKKLKTLAGEGKDSQKKKEKKEDDKENEETVVDITVE